MADDRFEQLEFKVAHLEKALQDLSDVLYRQQREIEALQARGQLLLEQVEQLGDRGGGGDADSVEIPPHY